MDQETKTLTWALKYHAAGWRIFPCENKAPHYEALKHWGRSWQKATDERVEEGTIRWWWTTFPNAQIGVACGKKSGLTVIDIDWIKDPSTREILTTQSIPPSDLVTKWCASMTSITGSGGRHIFCKSSDTPNSAKTVHPQVDIKSEGGYVILPPSVHPNGKRYEWDPLFPWSINNLLQLSPFPNQLTNERQEPTKDKWPRIVHGTSQGARNSSAAQLAGKLVRHFTEHEAWALLSSWNASKNSPPLSEKELLNTFLSIMKKHYGGRLRSHR